MSSGQYSSSLQYSVMAWDRHSGTQYIYSYFQLTYHHFQFYVTLNIQLTSFYISSGVIIKNTTECGAERRRVRSLGESILTGLKPISRSSLTHSPRARSTGQGGCRLPQISHWNTSGSFLSCLWLFHTLTAELSIRDRDHLACRAQIYYVVLQRKSLMTPDLSHTATLTYRACQSPTGF